MLAKEIEALARAIAGPGAGVEMLERANKVAEAQIDLQRVRSARHQLLTRALGGPNFESSARVRKKARLLSSLLRLRAPEIRMETLEAYLTSTPEGPSKFTMVLSEHIKQLTAIDRYERRTLSRRKFAIREFDSGR
jgi:hypothetical protein